VDNTAWSATFLSFTTKLLAFCSYEVAELVPGRKVVYSVASDLHHATEQIVIMPDPNNPKARHSVLLAASGFVLGQPLPYSRVLPL
jgi:hypothetical protein